MGLEPTDSVTIFVPPVPIWGCPVWTKENRARYDRSGLRYERDLTDEEWAEIAPLIPPAKPGGNPRSLGEPRGGAIVSDCFADGEYRPSGGWGASRGRLFF